MQNNNWLPQEQIIKLFPSMHRQFNVLKHQHYLLQYITLKAKGNKKCVKRPMMYETIVNVSNRWLNAKENVTPKIMHEINANSELKMQIDRHYIIILLRFMQWGQYIFKKRKCKIKMYNSY